MADQQDEEGTIQNFSCRHENVKNITEILSCLSVDLTKDHPCHIEVSPQALVFMVNGRSKTTQAHISLSPELFEEFTCDSPSIRFIVNLTVFIDCLHLFGSSHDTTSASMSYSSEDALFRLSLEEAGVVTTCDITTLYQDDEEDINTHQGLFSAFRENPEECQILIKSDALKETIHELVDSFWAGPVHFEVNNTPGELRLSTGGMLGISEITMPRNCDAFCSFRCLNAIRNSYALKSLLLGMKALTVSKETYIRINTEGIMCVQHQIQTSKGDEIYFDFLIVAEESFEGDDDGGGDVR